VLFNNLTKENHDFSIQRANAIHFDVFQCLSRIIVPTSGKGEGQIETKLIGNDNDGLMLRQMASRPVAFRWVTERQLAKIRF
jgi:hypothetical protein